MAASLLSTCVGYDVPFLSFVPLYCWIIKPAEFSAGHKWQVATWQITSAVFDQWRRER